jgi:hypothetical protein
MEVMRLLLKYELFCGFSFGIKKIVSHRDLFFLNESILSRVSGNLCKVLGIQFCAW